MNTVYKKTLSEPLNTENRCAEEAELLRSRVDLLAGQDRILMKMRLENGNSFRQMALLLGLNEGTISRRIHKLTERLINSKYLLCLKHRNIFTKDEIEVAREHFLLGRSIRRIATEQNYTYYQVRETIKKIQQLTET